MGSKAIAHEGLWEQLGGLEGCETARRAKCEYLDEPGRYVITMLNSEYVVDVSEKRIFCEHSGS